MSNYVSYNCICCNKMLEGDVTKDPLDISPVFDGLVFRSSGNFGSTIFDPMPIDTEEYLQVIICDGCIKKNARRVTRIHNVSRVVTSDIEPFDPDRS